MSCAGSKSIPAKLIPEGSQSLGVYEGAFRGDMSKGSILIHLFQTPEGDKLFRATVDVKDAPFIENKVLFVRGKMTANSLEGEFQGDASGTIGGQLSPDDNQLTGSFIITAPGFLNYGTWKTTKIRNLGGSVPKFITF